MAELSFDIRTNKEWKRFLSLMKARRFKGDLNRQLRRATIANGAIAKAIVRDKMKQGLALFEKNRPLQLMIKFRAGRSGAKPTIAGGELFKAIAKATISDLAVEVGVRKASPEADIAKIVHDGAFVVVTPKMRTMFSVLAAASDSGRESTPNLRGRARELFAVRATGWKPLSPRTTVLEIPGRPFIREAIKDPKLRFLVARNYADAVAAAIAGKQFRPRTRP